MYTDQFILFSYPHHPSDPCSIIIVNKFLPPFPAVHFNWISIITAGIFGLFLTLLMKY